MRLKPLRKPGAIPVLQEVRGTSLAGFADQLLLDRAQVQSEGAVERSGRGGPVFYGSTMVTIPLDEGPFSRLVREVDQSDLLEALRRSISLHIRLMRLARVEAERRSSPLLPRGMLSDLEFKIEGEMLLVDINVECPLADPSESADDAGESR
jgi:hypothetical protein